MDANRLEKGRLSMIGKWIELIYKVATGSWKTRLALAPLVAVMFVSLIGLLIGLSFAADRFLSFPKALFPSWSKAGGLALLALGLFIMVLSIFYFIKAKGTPVPLNPPPKLVKDGPYQFVRNPMLTGIFMQLFGLGIATGSPSLAFIFTPLFIGVNIWELKTIEEPELVKRLGAEYVEYKKKVPMFFPFRIGRNAQPNRQP